MTRSDLRYDGSALKARIDCRDLAQATIPSHFVRRQGKMDRYYSPFREDGRSAAFSAYADGFKDYGGEGRYYDAIAFIQTLKQLDYAAACDWLWDWIGGAPTAPITAAPRRQARNTPPNAAWQTAVRAQLARWQAQLWANDAVLNYLRHIRGLSDETIRTAQLGYNPVWTGFRCEGKQLKVAPGIVLPWFADSQLYAVRIRTHTGQLAQMTGKDDSALDSKYMSVRGSRQSAGFYHVDAIQADQPVLIVEGEFDALLASQQWPVVAVTRGSAGDHRYLDGKWIQRLQDVETLYALLDNDAAGQGAQAALSAQLPQLTPLSLPAGKDVTDFIVEQGGQWQQLQVQPRPAPSISLSETRPATRQPTPALPSFSADAQVNLRYISELPTAYYQQPTLLIKSPLATGKTELARRMIAAQAPERNILVLTHRAALAENIAERLEMESYKTIPTEYLPSASRLVCSFDSLHKIGAVDRFDLLIIDEFEQFVPHLWAGTIRNQLRQYSLLVKALRRTQQVVALDAHMSDLSREFLEMTHGSAPYAIENSYRHEWGTLHLHAHSTTVLREALDVQAQTGQTVVIVTDARAQSFVYEQLAAAQVGADQIMLINGHTSGTRTGRAFIKDINAHLGRYRFLITNGSLGTGIDVQTPVAGVFGIFSRAAWIRASDIMQMMMRYRNAATRHLYVVPGQGEEEADWLRLYQRHLTRVTGTEQAAAFAQHQVEPDLALYQIMNWQCKWQAAGAQQRNALRDYTRAFARAEGFTVEILEGEALPAILADLKAAHTALKAATREGVLHATPITPEEAEAMRQQGGLSREDSQTLHWGLARHHIEDLVGCTITEDIYERYHSKRARARLHSTLDGLSLIEEVAKRDRAQAQAGDLMMRWGHYTARTRLSCAGIEAVLPGTMACLRSGALDQLNQHGELTAETIMARLQPFLAAEYDAIQTYVDGRKDLSSNPLDIFRRLLKQQSLRLVSRQRMVDGVRFRVYSLDLEGRQAEDFYIQSALAARRARENQPQRPLLGSRNGPESYRDLSNAVVVAQRNAGKRPREGDEADRLRSGPLLTAP